MHDRSSEAFDAELRELGARWGAPARIVAELERVDFDPIARRDRAGEVCMVVRRASGGRILVSIKTFYPRQGWRLPTGGIHLGEAIADALVREADEETGLDLRVERFLALVEYRRRGIPRAVFHTAAFLLTELGGTLAPRDADEQIEGYREIEIDELPAIAETLASIPHAAAPAIGGSWSDWGLFRAVAHRAVYDALRAK